MVLGAQTGIWIVEDPRPEHVGAIKGLNESASVGFYLVKVEAVQIGDSPPDPLLTLIVGSSEEARQIGKTKEGLAKREGMRLAFWERLLVRAESKTQLHANISAGPQNWISATAGRNGFSYQYWVVMENADVQFYIDTSDEGVSVYYFEMLHELKSNIDEAFGEPLLWEPMEGRQACRVRK